MSSNGSTTSSFPTSLTRACATCARAKAKCIAGLESDGKCQRCHRLHKACEPAVAQPRSLPRKRMAVSRTDHVQKLEQKLDGLVTLLKSNQTPHPNLEINPITAEYRGASIEQLHSMDFLTPATAPEQSCDTLSVQPSFPSTPHLSSPFTKSHDFSPMEQEADIVLTKYREGASSHFPFALLSPTITGRQLLQERPFLYLCIDAIANVELSLQTAPQLNEIRTAIMRQLAERMFVNGERNLELLLGVLVYAAGSVYNFANIPQLTSLLAAAMTLLCDLGLDRPIPTSSPNRGPFEDTVRPSTTARYLAIVNTKRSQEERRAFLGCYFLSSVLSSYFRRTQTIRFSPYIEECVTSLLEVEEHPDDRLAAALIKLQIISEKIYQTPWHDKYNWPDILPGTMFIVNSLKVQLKQFHNALSYDLQQNAILLIHYHATEIALYEVGLSKQYPSNHITDPEFQRLEILHACLLASKNLFDTFFSIPVLQYFNFAVTAWARVSYCLIITQALTTFNHQEWNLEYVRQTIDFYDIVDCLAAQFEKAAAAPEFERSLIFTRIAKKMRSVKRNANPVNRGSDFSTYTHSDPLDFSVPEVANTGDFMDFLDEVWLRDVLGP